MCTVAQDPRVHARVLAAVVTHNRLALLEECVGQLRSQTCPVDILVVDSGSTDETPRWLSEQRDVAYIRQRNLGGAAGFHTAIKVGYWLGYDFVWCMDDDTVPADDCLEALLASVAQHPPDDPPIGWVCSSVRWVDGSPAMINRPVLAPDGERPDPSGDSNSVPAAACSFVSVCISREAVAAVGLPLREMFIYLDDIEYTRRITEAGFLGLVSHLSTALHKTPTNDPWPTGLNRTNRWKSRYLFRNWAATIRTASKASWVRFVYLFAQRTWWTTRSLVTNGKAMWVPYAWYWLMVGLFFRPRPDAADRDWDHVLRDLL